MESTIPVPPAQWISPDDIRKEPPLSWEELLSRIPGLTVVPDESVSFRGKSMTYLINGVEFVGTYRELQERVDVNDIAQVDIYDDPAIAVRYMTEASFTMAVTTWPPGQNPNEKEKNYVLLLPLGYQEPESFYSPKYDTPEALTNPTPDLRSTIYWKPDLSLTASAGTTIDFYSADSPGTYTVVAEGVGYNRKLIYYRKEALIKVEK